MSGFVAVLRADGGPLARPELEPMMEALAPRGPHGQVLWVESGVAFGISQFNADEGGACVPMGSRDGIRVAADARIDARQDLLHDLRHAGIDVDASAGDSELILAAYRAWGDDCATHLLGDFSFVLWDGARRHLLAARDPIGIKQLHYAVLGPWVLVSNDIACLRRHPSVSPRLNDAAIADLLLFDCNQDPGRTSFRDILRVPPGHLLACAVPSDRQVRAQVRRYWALPVEPAMVRMAAADRIALFGDLLERAVKDRLCGCAVAAQMSGGLDSPSVAAVARRQGVRVNAFGTFYEHLIADDEVQFARIAARGIGVPLSELAGDAYAPFAHFSSGVRFPEPFHNPEHMLVMEGARRMAGFARVALTGWDGDTWMHESPRPYLRHLAGRGQWALFLAVMADYAWRHKRVVPPSWLASARSWFRAPAVPEQREYPAWIHPDLERRFDLRRRWAQFAGPLDRSHPTRPGAYGDFEFQQRQTAFFPSMEPVMTGAPLEFRHPLLDLRLIDFCLSLPPAPWCDNKEILRRSMRSMLPEVILRRPKTPLNGFPFLERMRRHSFESVGSLDERVSAYVQRDNMPASWVADRERPAKTWSDLRILSLHLWLRQSDAEPETC